MVRSINNLLRKNIDKLGEIISKIIPIPYYHKELDNSLRSYGINVKYFTNKQYDAFLFWDYTNNQPVIAINALESKTRRNFSMAHELGHLIINYKWSPLETSYHAPKNKILATEYRGGYYSKKQLRNERIMDEFAAAYLMPTYLLCNFISKKQDKNRSYMEIVTSIAYKFCVSRAAAQIRLNHYVDSLER